jgi:hypothetical protein
MALSLLLPQQRDREKPNGNGRIPEDSDQAMLSTGKKSVSTISKA